MTFPPQFPPVPQNSPSFSPPDFFCLIFLHALPSPSLTYFSSGLSQLPFASSFDELRCLSQLTSFSSPPNGAIAAFPFLHPTLAAIGLFSSPKENAEVIRLGSCSPESPSPVSICSVSLMFLILRPCRFLPYGVIPPRVPFSLDPLAFLDELACVLPL